MLSTLLSLSQAVTKITLIIKENVQLQSPYASRRICLKGWDLIKSLTHQGILIKVQPISGELN